MDKEKKVVSISNKEKSKLELLDQWLKELVYPGKVCNFIEEDSGQSEPGVETTRNFCFYTEKHQYFITAVERNKGDGYLGCQVNARKARAGEDWLRGNDLPDGPFTRATWDKIINAIVCYELVRLSDYTRPESVPE